MKFSEYLSESAIMISSDMREYVETAIKKIQNAVKGCVTYTYFCKKYDRKSVFYKIVESKYGSFGISTIIRIPTNIHSPAASIGNFGSLEIYISKNDYENIDKKETVDHLTIAILHEIVHIVDPKDRKSELKKISQSKIREFNVELKKNQSQLSSEKDPEKIKILQDNISEIIKKYFKFDWEIDAYVSSEAQMIAEDILKKSRTKRDALEYIKNFVPDIPVLKFYKTQPTIWKRFIMHLTKIVERDYK
jgi:hypothetical protein